LAINSAAKGLFADLISDLAYATVVLHRSAR